MAVSTGTMMAISAAVSIAGQLQQARAVKQAANADAQIMDTQAAQQRQQAEDEADRIRVAARKTKGAARAQMAANGIAVNEGTALTIEDDINRESERDAFNVLLTGKRRADAATYQAAQARARGGNATSASVLGSVSTGLQGWKGVKQDPEYRYKVPDYPGGEY